MADLNIEVGDTFISRFTSCGSNSYVMTVDLEKQEEGHAGNLIVLEHIEWNGSNRELREYCEANPEELLKLIKSDDAHVFSLKEFDKSDYRMDETRVMKNIAMAATGPNIEHAMTVALLAEYGLVGAKAIEFSHRKDFADMQSFLATKFPDGPPVLKGANVSEPGAFLIRFGASVVNEGNDTKIGGIIIPDGVDIEAALAKIEDYGLQVPSSSRPSGMNANV